jgi:putative membrane protein
LGEESVTEYPHEPTPLDDPSVHLSSNRTALSLERTRLSIERTLMSVIRTSLSLISFGFTIFQVFNKLVQKEHPGDAVRNFGATLILLGIVLLILGLVGHVQQFHDLRRRRDELHDLGLVAHGPQYRMSPIALIAFLLLILGFVAIAGMMLHEGPLS